MFTIGCHLSISQGFYRAGLDAVSIGANTFQFFTRNPRGGKAKEIDTEDINKLRELMEEKAFGPLVAHGAYTMNLCSDKPATRAFAKMIFKEDLERLSHLPHARYVFHPGSHVGQGAKQGVQLIVEALNELLPEHLNHWVLLEGMSGKGSEVGGTLEELKAIIDGVTHSKRLGICLDSCHLYAAGYDVVNDSDGVIRQVNDTVGLDKLQAFHLNDSMTDFASNKDRHEVIGEGSLGLKAIENIINHPALKHLPFNLETPNELEGYKEEIKMLKGLVR